MLHDLIKQLLTNLTITVRRDTGETETDTHLGLVSEVSLQTLHVPVQL